MMRPLLLLLVGVLFWTGCKSTSFVGRRYDNFTAYYNTFYNAKKSLRQGLQNLERTEQPVDRNLYLPLFTSQDRASNNRDFDEAVKKGADVLREHPDSKWVDDALMLIGKAYFYQRNYVGSQQKFQEVIDLGSALEDEGRFWMARSRIAGADYPAAEDLLKESLNREGHDRKWTPMFRLALGELYVKQGAWELAAEELEAGVAGVKDKDLGAEAQFLLGQVYERLERYEEAVEAYERVRRFKPLYELSYAAQLSAVRCEGQYGDANRALRALRKMERDDKNYTYRNELVYMRGRILHVMGRHDDALDTFDALLYDEDPTKNISAIRGHAHYALGELFRDAYGDYILAAAHFDTAATAIRLPEGVVGSTIGPDGRNISYTMEAIIDADDTAEQFRNFATVSSSIAHMDSLLYLGELDQDEFDARILELREARAEELREQRRLQAQRQAEQGFSQTVTTTRDGRPGSGKIIPGINDAGVSEDDFLFHKDPVRAQEGQLIFVNRWGRRPLVPNWRRLEAVEAAAAQAEAENGGTQAANDAFLDAGMELPQVDISEVPRDSLAQTTMRGQRALARYELGNVLFLGMNEPDSAAVWYRMVIEEDSEHRVAQRAFYALAEVQRALGDSLSAQRLYEQVVRDYPTSDFAGRVRQQLGIEDQSVPTQDSLSLAMASYETHFSAWERKDYAPALDGMVALASTYPSTEYAPKGLLAASLVFTEWAERDSLDLFGPLPLTVPDSVLYAIGLATPPEPIVPDSADGEIAASILDPEPEPSGAPDSLQTSIVPPDSTQSLPADSLGAVATDSTLVVEGAAELEDASPPEVVRPAVLLADLYAHIQSEYAATPYARVAGERQTLLDAQRAAWETAMAPPPPPPVDSTAVAEVDSSAAALPGTTLLVESDSLAAVPAEGDGAALDEESPQDVLGEEPLEEALPPGEEEPGTVQAQLPAADEDGVLRNAEQMPELIGGMQMLMSRFKYPEEAKANRLRGPVFVEFVVTEEGGVEAPTVVRGLGMGCDAEALRVMQTAKFKPGQQDGKPVKVRMSFPLICGGPGQQ